jgi:hypothetical protein
MNITENYAREIFDILVEDVSANKNSLEEFLVWSENGEREFRFVGCLGYGGKFWNYNDKWYVNCYSEDLTPKRQTVIDKVNDKLAALLSQCIIVRNLSQPILRKSLSKYDMKKAITALREHYTMKEIAQLTKLNIRTVQRYLNHNER